VLEWKRMSGNHDDPSDSGTVGPWRVALVTLHGTFTVFACVTMVQFYKMREKFFLKERHPLLAILQLAACAVGVFIDGCLSPLIEGTATFHFFHNVFINMISSLIMFLHVVRAWNLYWRIFVGKRFSQSRTILRSQIEKQGSDISKTSCTLDSPTTSRTQFKTWKFKAKKYSILGFFSALLITEVLISVGSYIAASVSGTELTDPTGSAMGIAILVSGVMAAYAVLVKVRKFHDNFNIHLEILRTTVVYFIVCPLILVLSFSGLTTPCGEPASREIFPFVFEVFFVIVGVFPLRDQRRLDRQVQECDFDHLESLEDVLEDAAALVALGISMRREFCDELLEFHQSVEKYKRKHELQSPEKRLNAARVIYAQFISPGAPTQINLSLSYIAEVHVKLFGGADRRPSNLSESGSVTDAPFDVFDNTQREVLNLIRRDPFVRFQIARMTPPASAATSTTAKVARRLSLSIKKPIRRLSHSKNISQIAVTSADTSSNSKSSSNSSRPSLIGGGSGGGKALASLPEDSKSTSSSSHHEKIPSGRRRSQSASRRLSLTGRRLSLASRRDDSVYGQIPESV